MNHIEIRRTLHGFRTGADKRGLARRMRLFDCYEDETRWTTSRHRGLGFVYGHSSFVLIYRSLVFYPLGRDMPLVDVTEGKCNGIPCISYTRLPVRSITDRLRLWIEQRMEDHGPEVLAEEAGCSIEEIMVAWKFDYPRHPFMLIGGDGARRERMVRKIEQYN